MNFYVVGYLPRESDPHAPDFRTGRIVSGHTDHETAVRMLAGLLWADTYRFGCLLRVVAREDLRGPLRRAVQVCRACRDAGRLARAD